MINLVNPAKTKSDMINLEFNAALMQKKALKGVGSIEQVQDICRQIQEKAEKGGFLLITTVRRDGLPDDVPPVSVEAFFRLLGFRVNFSDSDSTKFTLEIWWDCDPDAMREVANQLYLMH